RLLVVGRPGDADVHLLRRRRRPGLLRRGLAGLGRRLRPLRDDAPRGRPHLRRGRPAPPGRQPHRRAPPPAPPRRAILGRGVPRPLPPLLRLALALLRLALPQHVLRQGRRRALAAVHARDAPPRPLLRRAVGHAVGRDLRRPARPLGRAAPP